MIRKNHFLKDFGSVRIKLIFLDIIFLVTLDLFLISETLGAWLNLFDKQQKFGSFFTPLYLYNSNSHSKAVCALFIKIYRKISAPHTKKTENTLFGTFVPASRAKITK